MKTLGKTSRWVPALVLLAFSLFVAAPASAEDAEYRVIVHKDNPVDSITKDLLSGYLLKKKSRWGHGIAADPVDLDSRSEVRAAFSKDIHGRSVASIKNYWQRQKSEAPRELASDQAVIDFVSSHPGAIGYVSAQAKLDGVKVLDLSSE